MHLVSFERLAGLGGRGRNNSQALPQRVGNLGDISLGLDTLEPGRPGVRRMGAVVQFGPHAGYVVDLNRALAIQLACDDVGAPEAEADSLVPSEMLAFLRLGSSARETARTAFDFAIESLDRYDAPDLLKAGAVEAPQQIHLCAPVQRPGKIVGVEPSDFRQEVSGSKTQDGSPETNTPGVPTLFLKAPSAVIGPDQEIVLPPGVGRVECAGQLAAVIGSNARWVPEDFALQHVAGYCVANEVTAHDIENASGQHFLGKSCDSFAPLGPELVTADEIPNPQKLALCTRVSGEAIQLSSTRELRYSVAAIIAFASSLMVLEPGDVILTAAPRATSTPQSAPRWLRDGDLVEVEIEQLGRLRNFVRG